MSLAPSFPTNIHAAPARAVLLACAMALTGCAQMPEREAPASISTPGDYPADTSFEAPIGIWPAADWWRSYGDSQLDALIGQALEHAPSVAAAEARMRQAAATADTSAAARSPQLAFDASVTAQKQSYNYLTPAEATPRGVEDYARATLDLSWNLDLWGRLRAGLAAATSEAEAARVDVAQARLMLSTAIASAYAELARLYAALDTAKAAFDVRSKTAELMARRLDNGLEIRGGVRQVDARRATAASEVLALQEQIALQRNRLAALAGAGPDRGLKLERPAAALLQAFAMPQRLSADLLGRRPDIVAARLRAEAAASRIEQARAAFYPDVNLVAFIGAQTLGIDMLARGGSSIGSIGPAISLPLFDGGRLRAQLRGADAAYGQAVADYERTLVQALQEVADAATSQRALAGQLARIGEAVEAARDAWRIQNERYVGGLSNYLDVLSAEDILIAALRSQSDLQSRGFSLDVALVRALGGGHATSRS
ncbi:efflux transporter outer membrane subunit [Variovorax fucosicus]|uniref:efflux transporter outer membrane subunit n=1 Tax=Variovorax fucosicus TaxID=3053517 RepID=UPI0025776280|nr:efflux transporter outer membrane subunit [Variovorax sp. J22G47]MDM0055100.1 efflux transporter outer membrane subunit [Variovorax sp. J22G47]